MIDAPDEETISEGTTPRPVGLYEMSAAVIGVENTLWLGNLAAIAVDSVQAAFAALDALTLGTIAAPITSVNFNGQQALNFRIENRTSDPAAPAVGQIWLRTDL